MSECRAEVPALIEETRSNWIESYRALMSKIQVPILLMWMSQDRRASDVLNLETLDLETLYFRFPQLVDATCLEPVKATVDAFMQALPQAHAGHPIFATVAEEETYCTQMELQWTSWFGYIHASMAPAYCWFRKTLQYTQWQNGGADRRWL
jgi:hypothetical protein